MFYHSECWHRRQPEHGFLSFFVGAMAPIRFLRLLNAKAANSMKTLVRPGFCTCSRRNVCSSPSRLQSYMSAWVIDQYGSNGVLRFTEEIALPVINVASEVMIKVNAASLNPLDVAMRGKQFHLICLNWVFGVCLNPKLILYSL